MLFVALADALEDLDRLFDAGLFDHDRLEAALERGVALDVLAVVVERGSADALQLAAGQRGLEDVGGVDSAFGGAGADEHVHLVDEEDAVAGVLDLFDDLLEALFELAAVLGAGDERTDIEGEQALALQRLRHVAVDDAVGQAFDDGGLADAGLADQDRVVLGAAREDLDQALDLAAAADDRVELAGARRGGEVDAQLVDGGRAGAGARRRQPALWGVVWERMRVVSVRTRSRLTPRDSRTPKAMPSPSRTRPRSRCSVPM